MIITDKIKTLLGFARKSNKLLSGESAVSAGLKHGNVMLVILASDMPEKRKFHWKRWCDDKNIRVYILASKKELGDILGMSDRGIIAVKDKQMAAALNQHLMKLKETEDINGGD